MLKPAPKNRITADNAVRVAAAAMAAPGRPESIIFSGGTPTLSWGLTLLNLSTYGMTNAGIAKGKIYRFVGRSSSGKTFISRTVLAEACQNRDFDDYELVYDDVEQGALMDTVKFFGKKLNERLSAPAYTKKKEPIYSRTTGDFFSRLKDRLNKGKKVIWIEDSLDSLEGESSNKMTDNKAKAYSQGLRELLWPLHETGSILILISQTRQKMNSQFPEDMASGGNAPEFYCTCEIWTRKVEKLKSSYRGIELVNGVRVMATTKKNRLSGLERTIFFPFYPSYGIDDIGANIDYLVGTKTFTKRNGIITSTDLNFEGYRSKLIQKIEAEGLEKELRILVGKTWRRFEAKCNPERKKRYE